MKAKVLISFYKGEGGHKAHRVYIEEWLAQAEKDLDLLLSCNSSLTWELQDVELYNIYTITKPK